jgi:hypothetical protein
MMTTIGQSPLRCRQFLVQLSLRKEKAPREVRWADVISAAGLSTLCSLCFVAANGTVSERTSRRHVTGTHCQKSIQGSHRGTRARPVPYQGI